MPMKKVGYVYCNAAGEIDFIKDTECGDIEFTSLQKTLRSAKKDADLHGGSYLKIRPVFMETKQ